MKPQEGTIHPYVYDVAIEPINDEGCRQNLVLKDVH